MGEFGKNIENVESKFEGKQQEVPKEYKNELSELLGDKIELEKNTEKQSNSFSESVKDLKKWLGDKQDYSSLKKDIDVGNDTNENTERYLSTYDERIKQTPQEHSERGEWEGERGESKYIPSDPKIKEILANYGKDGIYYKDGIPDFSDVSEATVDIDNMSENRADNFRQADEKCAEKWNKEARDGRTDWTARDVANWRKENGYTWHERNDMKTMDLVPTEINSYFGHLGGVSECKKRDNEQTGGDFDEFD